MNEKLNSIIYKIFITTSNIWILHSLRSSDGNNNHKGFEYICIHVEPNKTLHFK